MEVFLWTQLNARLKLAQWHGSGLKLAKFARKVGISPNTLKQWDKETGIKKGAEKKPMPAEVSGMDEKGNMKGMEVVKIADLKVKSPESQASGIHLNIRGVTIYLDQEFNADTLKRVLEVISSC